MFWILIILAFMLPRLTIFILWFFTHWFNGMFHSIIWPILGFLFLPATLLWYGIVFHYFDNNWTTIPIVGIVIAVLIDLSPGRSGKYRRRREDY